MMALPEAMSVHDSLGGLVRRHRAALGLTQQALARACELSPVYISQIEKGERIPSVAACRALAQALGCAPRLLVLRAFRATAPAEIQDLLRDEGVVGSEDPVWQELTPLLTSVQTLPQATRQQIVQLWQASLKWCRAVASRRQARRRRRSARPQSRMRARRIIEGRHVCLPVVHLCAIIKL